MSDDNLVPAPDEAMIEIGWVLLSPLRIPKYQREAYELRVKRLLPFDLRASGTLELSYRQKTLWIVDGQARRIAGQRSGFDRLPARINYDLDEAAEARLYLRHNRDRLVVSALDRHKAEAVGQEPRAVEIDEVLEANGLIAGTAQVGELRPFRSISKAERVYDEGGADLVARVLRLLEEGLPGDSQRFRGTLVGGLGIFLARDPWGADDKRVLAALRRTSGAKLDEKMRYVQSLVGKPTSGSPVHMARAIAIVVYRERGIEWKPQQRAPHVQPPDKRGEDE